MIKTILVPATGSDLDIAVFRSALTVARAFAPHFEVLHVHVDATAVAAAMVSDAGVGVGATVIGMVDQIEEDASRREAKAKQSFQEFCAREQVVLADTPIFANRRAFFHPFTAWAPCTTLMLSTAAGAGGIYS